MSPALTKICDGFGITVVPTKAYRHPMETHAERTMENILARFGEERLTLVLRSIVETENNARELVAPTIWAISDIIGAHPTWPTSTDWLNALDGVDMAGIRALAKENRDAARLRPAIATMMFLRLRQTFEPRAQGELL